MPPSATWKHATTAYVATISAWLLYAVLSLASPTPTAQAAYHITGPQVFALQLTIAVPLLIIWLVALRSAIGAKDYVQAIHGGPEAAALNLIANGLFFMAAYVVVIGLLSAITPYLVHSPALATMVTLRNHLPLVISLVGFGLLYHGSQRLKAAANFTTWTPLTGWLFAGLCLFAAGFTWLFTVTPAGSDSRGIPNYSLPRATLLVTMVLPYFIAWFLGLLASRNIARYSSQVKGIIYRLALRDVARGLVLIIVMGMLFQLLNLAMRLLLGLRLGAILLILYALLILYGSGFWLVRAGFKKLLRLEVTQ
ncbi:MAG TPA: hypothetical protein VLI05_04940 [Candidatus Saccharimonadia bacterium]|nr:hypothetical protein [Candidatus Saccharimonadia bacterium]